MQAKRDWKRTYNDPAERGDNDPAERGDNDQDWNSKIWDWIKETGIGTKRGIANGPVCEDVDNQEDCLKELQKAMDKALDPLDSEYGIRNLRGEQQQRNLQKRCFAGFAGCFSRFGEGQFCFFMAPAYACRRRLWWFSFDGWDNEDEDPTVAEDEVREIYNDKCFVDTFPSRSQLFASKVREEMPNEFHLDGVEIKLQVKVC